jgi:hypothetical protein
MRLFPGSTMATAAAGVLWALSPTAPAYGMHPRQPSPRLRPGITAPLPGGAHPAGDAIIAAFATHRIVLLGEEHWRKAEHRFIQQLLRDRRLPDVANDIAVEFANSLYQPLIDRYTAGENVPFDSVRLAWVNAIVPLAWDATVYGDFFRTVRQINRGLPPEKRFRVIALDPPIAWSDVRTAEDIPRQWGYRDPAWVEVLEREVFAKHRKALVICGALHVLRRDPPANFQPAPLDRAGLGDALAQMHPGESYAFYPVIGTKGLAASIRTWPVNTVDEVAGTPLGARSSHLLVPGNVVIFAMVDGKRVPRQLQESDYPPIEVLIDALVYFGPDTSMSAQDLAPFRNRAFVAELHRRSKVLEPIFGLDLDSTIDVRARGACHAKRGGSPAACD